MLVTFGMKESKPVVTPEVLVMNPENPSKPYGPSVNDPQYPYHIAHAVKVLGRFTTCYTKEHYVMAKRVMRYLRGTIDFGLVYRNPKLVNNRISIEAYADADLGNCKDTGRSVTDYQSNAVDDTCSAEYVAGDQCLTKIQWTHNLCVELKIKRNMTVLHNQSAITCLNNTNKKYKVRGVALKYHKLKDMVTKKEVTVQYCPSEDMVVDVLTKPLSGSFFAKHWKLFGVEDVNDAKAKCRRVG
ncbi:hypothetical protein PsorP6_009282 [Peronosclerospora sorghi]|uniref:Uncharacterized protein n=1 Tax=Peronosclerospora sorghi TaxID=230839 RepID=A0ACC0VYB0_9STRA|nr:hypothetical protein PsorP6_009282 [Peronosclerospora sorghi]